MISYLCLLLLASSGPSLARDPEGAREGIYLGGSVPVGASFTTRGLAPTLGLQLEAGGVVSRRLSVGAALGIAGYRGRGRSGGVGEVQMDVFPHPSVYVKLGLGAALSTPKFPLDGDPWLASLGASAGIGAELFATRRMAFRIGPEYAARMRVDGVYVHTVLFAVGMRRYHVGYN